MLLFLTWLGIIWATGWAVWATWDSFMQPRWHYYPMHVLNLVFCLIWLAFVSLRFFGVVEGEDYLDMVAPLSPFVFFIGPWSMWTIVHWEARISKRRSFKRRRTD